MSEGRFVIGSCCVGCGVCLGACPAMCIEEGDPFRIDEEHCLQCGLCAEVCPTGAVAEEEG